MKILKYIEQHLKILVATLVAGSMMLVTAGCSEVDGGSVQNTVELPTDSVLNFACEDEGIYLEPCVLDNPQNPYAKVAVIEDNKFELSDAAPSAKARYYVWATALAKGAGIPGENQFYTALSLHEVFAESGSPTTREQAVKAYRSVLDNYFFAPTFFVFPVNGEDVAIAAPLKDLVGQNLFNPTAANLVSLYSDPALALQDISEWGFIYDPTTNIMSFFE
ncbi:MAG: hypothetical protein KJN89_08100 [Gammaproteobacteria bacterium]|nr:hypothetical protein [Gammaproteobacteria bacterium]NNJ50324.1 hypothetical protein [Gammaproteobacteria bacterium]